MVLENFIVDAPIVWDRVGKKIFENPHVKQGRKMRVQITNAGMVEDLSGYTLALGWKHTVSGVDGLDVFEDDSEANVGIFEMAYTENLMTNLGNLKASLVLTNVEDMVVAESNDFYVKVDDSPFGANAEQGVGSYTRLAQILLNEEIRDAEFDNAQFDRNVDFEVANTARNEAFALAQTQRNTDFGTDQAARVLAFNNAETARVNAFNLAEAARAEGYATDHARAESDHTRADVDSATVGGYNARLTDVEVDTSFDATNLVTNGDFSNGTIGWWDSMLTVTNGVARLVSDNIGGGNQAYPNVSQGTVKGNGGSKYYIRALISEFVKVGYAVGFFQLGLSATTPTFASSGVKSHIMTPSASFNTLYINHTLNAGASIDYRIDNIILIDLTATFGKGNEPTVEQMDAIMAKFENSWFDGTKNLFQAKASVNKLMALDARTEFEAKNLVDNGDFLTGTERWTGINQVVSGVAEKVVSMQYDSIQQYIANHTVYGNRKIYGCAMVKTTSPNVKFAISDGLSNSEVTSIGDGAFRTYSVLKTMAPVPTTFAVKVHDVRASGWDTFYVDKVLVIDLTATFGAGKEPTLAEMDRLMARFPNSWFNGVKPIQTIETLYQEKANKVQEAWITPTLLNGWTGSIGYAKNDTGMVNIYFDLIVGTGTAFTSILSLPIIYAPKRNMVVRAVNNSSGIAYDFRMYSSGGFHNLTALTTGHNLSGVVSYFAG